MRASEFITEGQRQHLDFDEIYGRYLKVTDNDGDPNKEGFSLVTPLNGASWNWRERPEFKEKVKRRLNQPGWLGDYKYQQIIDAMAGNKFDPVKHLATENFADGNSDLDTIIQKFVDSPSGQKYKAHDCKTVTRAFVTWAEQNNIPTEVITFAPPSAEFVQKNPQFKGKSGEGDGHIMPIVNGNAIDFTIRQFGVNKPFDNPLVTPVSNIKSAYSKFGYFTDAPDWFLNGKTHWKGPLKSIPSAIFNQDFGDELLENFADGKKPGRKGLAKRSGVNTKASVSSLRKTAKNSSGEKARMAHWLANMKAGRAKKNK